MQNKVRYQNPMLEPSLEVITVQFGGYECFRQYHPDYHLFAELTERLPKFVRLLNELSQRNLNLPLNERGLPF